jgi:hypothetical protein
MDGASDAQLERQREPVDRVPYDLHSGSLPSTNDLIAMLGPFEQVCYCF